MLHKNSPPANNHVIQSWSLADTTALDALVPTVLDIGKIAYVSAGPTFYILMSAGPAVWRVLLTGEYPPP